MGGCERAFKSTPFTNILKKPRPEMKSVASDTDVWSIWTLFMMRGAWRMLSGAAIHLAVPPVHGVHDTCHEVSSFGTFYGISFMVPPANFPEIEPTTLEGRTGIPIGKKPNNIQ